MLDVEYIKESVKKVAYLDMEYKLFGSWGHAHIFKPVIEESKLALWEENMQLKLPKDYKIYLTKLGNGGAGPAYGLSKFSLPFKQKLKEPTIYADEQAKEFNKCAQAWFDMESIGEEEFYEQYYQQHPQEKRLSFQDWESAFFENYYDSLSSKLFEQGQYMIANQGCSVDIYLLFNGSQCGMCHTNSNEYDCSYPLTREQIKKAKLAQESQRAITWIEYKESLIEFSDYINNYVKNSLDEINKFTQKQFSQFEKEREQVLEFEQAFIEKDIQGLEYLISKLTPATFSAKTRSFYLESCKQLLQQYKDNMIFQEFALKTEYRKKGWEYRTVVFEHNVTNNGTYPHPTFDEFKLTFKPIDN